MDDVLLVTELGPHAMKRSSRLSGGMKRKLCTALSLIGNPSVVSHLVMSPRPSRFAFCSLYPASFTSASPFPIDRFLWTNQVPV